MQIKVASLRDFFQQQKKKVAQEQWQLLPVLAQRNIAQRGPKSYLMEILTSAATRSKIIIIEKYEYGAF